MPDPNRVELNRDLLLQRIQEIRGALAILQEHLGDVEAYLAAVGRLLDEARP